MSPIPVTVATLLTDEVRLPLTWLSHYPEISWSHYQSFGLQGSILLATQIEQRWDKLSGCKHLYQ